jgi:murein DD-endopeptidase MepM/ murein hydrolase activator NlpD
MEFFSILHLPPLAASFNIVTIFFLFALKTSINPYELSLYIIPLHEVVSPEENLKTYKEKHILTRIKKRDFSLPFSGYWYVSQGNNGKLTHKREGHYAWDFIALDDSGSSHKNGGETLEDYYTFGLPVFAPAGGVVVKIVQNIPDNKPSEKNKEHRWGNYVIIKHDYDMFSEISHFKCNSIFVTENQSVEKGSFLGYCGNSGYSPEPHIHYQLQSEDFTGARTLPVEFSSYVIKSNPKEIFVERGVPQKGHITGNYNPI